MERVRTGVIGCGNISPAYLGNINKYFSHIIDLQVVADIDVSRAEKRATEFKVPKACTVTELLGNKDIELVLNLTPFIAHYDVSMSILNAGKHLFTEKSLAVTFDQGRMIAETAKSKGLFAGGASDTFLAAGLQACRKTLDEDGIGDASYAVAFASLGARSEHYLNVFGGPMFDMAPYYITALVALLGPAVRVAGSAQMLCKELPYPSQHPNAGKTFKVTRPTTISGVVDFASGCVASITASVDVCGYFPNMEIHGTKASMFVGDANGYKAGSKLRYRDGTTKEIPMDGGFREDGRALGVAEMAVALRESRPPRASVDLMLHVLEIMHTIHDSSVSGKHITLQTTCKRPEIFDFSKISA